MNVNGWIAELRDRHAKVVATIGVLETLNAAARLLLAKYSKTPNANVTGMAPAVPSVAVPPPADDPQVQTGSALA